MLAEYDISPNNLFSFFSQNGCMYVGCGESHADHSTVHSQVRALPRTFTSYAIHDGIGYSQCSVLDLTQALYWFSVLPFLSVWLQSLHFLNAFFCFLFCFFVFFFTLVQLWQWILYFFGGVGWSGIYSYDILSYFLCWSIT